jgi:hypothetical protein
MVTKKVSDFVDINPPNTWQNTQKVSLSDLDGETITVTALARSVIAGDTAYSFRTDDNREFMTGAQAFLRMGEGLISSDNIGAQREHDDFKDCTLYELVEPVAFKMVSKHNPKTGRDFYTILDPDE